ncbi:MAG: hypothetical protein KI785_16105 [Devosiaceae bacterium]|nr:hypothetical protein [Devosiaceae bacterium MH13]
MPPQAEGRPTALYASPIRAGLAALCLLGVGISLAGVPFYQVLSGAALPLSSGTLIAALAFLVFGSLIAFPGYQFAKAILTSSPLVTTDGTEVHRVRMGLGSTSIAWADVGDLGLRGIWIILVDARISQTKFGQSMFGARGLWLPALFVHGGGAATVQFIAAYRGDLIDPVLNQATRGKAGRPAAPRETDR